MQKARRHCSIQLRPLVSIRFQGLFHSLSSGYFSPFPYGTSSLSVSEEYLALPDGAGKFTQDYSSPALLWIPHAYIKLCIRGFHSLWPDFPDSSTRSTQAKSGP